MDERPILFSGPMVRAILDGRKTQTRRVMKEQPYHASRCRAPRLEDDGWYFTTEEPEGIYIGNGPYRCPYGQPGDLLWVRETWRDPFDADIPVYRADKATAWENLKWRPSIHMPKKYARIWLRVTDIRAERVQEISTEDCYSEGVKPSYYQPHTPHGDRAVWIVFQETWDSINAKRGYSWESDPWVWVVSFERVRC